MPQITEAAEELEERRQEYERKLEQQQRFYQGFYQELERRRLEREANHPRHIPQKVEAPTASTEYAQPEPILVPAHVPCP